MVMLKYIDENLKKVMENLDRVLYFKPFEVGNKTALFAVVNEKPGIYRKIQITKEQSKGTFPFEPIYWFYNGPGYLFLNDFISISNNWMALNTVNMDGFISKKLDDFRKFNIGIYATFNDGSATFIERESEKGLKRRGGIESYNNMLKQFKECKLQHDVYYPINDNFGDDNTIIITKLLDSKDLILKKIDYEQLKLQSNDENDTTSLDRVVIPPEAVHESVKVLSRVKKDKKK